MPLFDYPGVYREEILSQRRVIQDVSTANLALVGFFEKGPVDEPVLVTDYPELVQVFGGFTDKSLAPTIASKYFANGGQYAFIVRTLGAGALEAVSLFEDLVVSEDSGAVSTGGGAAEVLAFTAGSLPIDPGSVRLFFNESTDVTAETIGTGDTVQVTFPIALLNVPVEPNSISITDGVETFTDDGSGVLSNGVTGTGTIDYSTGLGSMTFDAAPLAVDIDADYTFAVATGHATVPNTPVTETVAAQVTGQRVYSGTLANTWPVYYVTTFDWTDQAAASKQAVVSSVGVVSGDAAGTLDLETGEFVLDVGADELAVGSNMTASYHYFNPLEATDDGAGALTTTGGLLASAGTVDYTTGAIAGTTVLLDDVGVSVLLDYSVPIHPMQAKNAGLSGNDLRVTLEANENYLDTATGLYSKYTVTVTEVDAEGDEASMGSFAGVVLDDLTDPKHIAQLLNDPYLGSDLIEMVTEFSDVIPTTLRGGTSTGVLMDTSTGVIRQIATTLPLNGGRGIVPGTLVISYTNAGQTVTITDDAQGGLTGSVDSSATASVDYDTAAVVFTPSLLPTTATTITAAYTYLSADLSIKATFTGGTDGAALTRSDVTDFALSATGEGIYALDTVDELLMLCVPDFAGDYVADLDQIAYVESTNRQDSMVIITPPEGSTVKQAIDYRIHVLASKSGRAAMYYPWIQIADPITGNTVNIPAHGHAAGIWAKTDLNRNIGKSPAGTTDGALTSLLGFEKELKKAEVGLLNNADVNCLWQPPRQPRAVWGVLTLDTDGEFRFISKRRTIDFVSVSIARSMWWTVFENVGPTLYAPIKSQIDGFLRRQFLSGVLKGNSEREAFFVKVDSGNNTTESIGQSQTIVDYGVATQTPGQFIRLRHRQIEG